MDLHTNPYTDGYFERAEGSNYRNYGDDPGWAVTARILRGFVPHESYPTLLELGSAKGYFLSAAQSAGFVPTGVDISKHAVESTPEWIRKRNYHGDVTRLFDIPAIEFQEFDVVCSWEFFEHIYPRDLIDVITDSIDLLKPGGLYVHRIAIVDGGMEEDQDSTHVSMYNRLHWETMFNNFGLKHEPELEKMLKDAFRGRDWADRFFVWRRV